MLYVRLPGEENSDCYYPLFLREKSYAALKCELAQKLNIDINSIDKILNKRKTTFQSGKQSNYFGSPKIHSPLSAGINVMVTDDMVATFKSESSYKVMIVNNSDSITLTIQQTS